MNVHLTFDVEVWCDDWGHLDETFAASYERYVYGNSSLGEWALPRTLEILNRHGLRAVFFVEPLFAARFGIDYLATIVRMLRDAGQEVQLHLHPEWTDEISPPLIADSTRKRQHLTYYSLDEQTTLIAHGRRMLEAVGSGPISAFRSGSYAADRNTFVALGRNGIMIDSSLNRHYDVSGPGLRTEHSFDAPFVVEGVSAYPVTVFNDGFGSSRPAQVNGCSFEEMRDALHLAAACGAGDFVIVSHNFEMLKPGTSLPDKIVVRRFERLCAFLDEQRSTLPTASFREIGETCNQNDTARKPLRTSLFATSARYAEQALRRIY